MSDSPKRLIPLADAIAPLVLALGIGAFYSYREYIPGGGWGQRSVIMFAIIAALSLALSSWMYWFGNRSDPGPKP